MGFVFTLAYAAGKRLNPGIDPLGTMLRFLVGIGVVFIAMWLVYLWVKRTRLGDYQGPGLRLVSRLALSRSTQVAVIEIGGRMFLVGAGDSNVTPIAELYETQEMAAELEALTAGETGRETSHNKRNKRDGGYAGDGQYASNTREKSPAPWQEGKRHAGAWQEGKEKNPVVKKPFSQVLAEMGKRTQMAQRTQMTQPGTIDSPGETPRSRQTGTTGKPARGETSRETPGKTKAGKPAQRGKPGSWIRVAGTKSGGSIPAALSPAENTPVNPADGLYGKETTPTPGGSGWVPQPAGVQTGVQTVVTEAQMDALAAQIAAEFGAKTKKPGGV